MTPRQPQRGFTLIELMVALVVSSLLVGMILAIFNRMSLAYRGQQQVAGVQQVLAAARAVIESDAKQAGFAMPQGFAVGTSGTVLWPVVITDSATAPDQIAFFYGDPTVQALITASSYPNTITVDSNVGFGNDDFVLLSTPDVTGAQITALANTEPIIAKYDACVYRLAPVNAVATPGQLRFTNVAPMAPPSGNACATVAGKTMVYKLVAHAYQIDPTAGRVALGVLRQSSTGGLFGELALAGDSWTDLAFGFTDIQTSLRIYDTGQGFFNSDVDGDGDNAREWLSGDYQRQATHTDMQFPVPQLPVNATALTVSISLVARTDRNVEGVATTTIPALSMGDPNFNSIGNRASIDLTGPVGPALTGSRIYRYVTFQVDLRNIGVGR